MAFAKIIAFDRPISTAVISGRGGRFCAETELAAIAQDGYNRGVDAARSLGDQQMVQFRADVEQLSEGVLKKLAGIEPLLLDQLRAALPELTLDLARRLLAGYEPPPEVIARLCAETLAELLPERENLELVVSPRDAAILAELKPDWMERYPGLKLRVDPAFGPGDCQVRSRFGLTDARQQTKLAALARSLDPS
jgi:flagellar assembly protein FliH